MLCKSGKQTGDFGGVLSFKFSLILYTLTAFLIKQLFHSRLLDMRLVTANKAWLFTISYPMRAHGIIVKCSLRA